MGVLGAPIDYLSPVQLGDTLGVLHCRMSDQKHGRALHHVVRGRPVAKAKTVLVCDHREKRITPQPQEWRDALEHPKAPSATNDPNLM